MTYKKTFLISFVLFLFATCIPVMAAEKHVELRFAFELPITHPWGKSAELFKNMLEDNKENNISVKLYPAGQLGKSGEDVQQGVMMGTIDVGISETPIVLLNPAQEVFDLPFIFESRQKAWKVLDSEVGTAVGNNLEKNGLKFIAYWEGGFRQVTNSKKQIKTLGDFAGLKIRTPYSPQRLKTFESLGCKPTAMPFSEVFSALEQKVIDGQENPLSVVWDSSLYDVQKYLTITNHVYTPATLFINLRKWKSFSPKQQEAILVAARAGRDLNRKLNKDNDEKLVDQLRAKGMVVDQLTPQELSKIQGAIKVVWDEYKTKHGTTGEEILTKITQMK